MNHLSLLFSYRIYAVLKKVDLLKKHSVNDILDKFSALSKISIDYNWVDNEISNKTSTLIAVSDFRRVRYSQQTA